ncbi:MFS transporter [Xanthobacter sp. V0B-10]|uniref:MFS transporter n=1 Tax=Xanthobacter albus TaxID=3119929 RepID=UPI00372ACA82
MSTEAAGGGRALAIIYATVALDAAGIGLVFPILPRLIQDVTHTANVAPYVGWMATLYAAMQFVFAPVLGLLSDRFGRRAILLLSLAGTVISYMVMAFAPQLWMLMLGRAVAGLTGANISVATAYITDITSGEDRARRFGTMNAMFGAGFIIGPILGGVLGEHWVRLPFIAAAAASAGNLLMAMFVLRETRPPSSAVRFDPGVFNPLSPMRWLWLPSMSSPFRSCCWGHGASAPAVSAEARKVSLRARATSRWCANAEDIVAAFPQPAALDPLRELTQSGAAFWHRRVS